MSRSPSRMGRRARHYQPPSFVALIALPFVLVGLVASKLAASSNRRRNRASITPDPEVAGTDNIEPVESSYRVELGDTVSEIAIRHGLPTAHVLAQNGLSWKTPIFPGQILRLDPIPDDLEWPAAETADKRDRRVG